MVEFEPDEEVLEVAIAREEEANRFFLILAARARNDEMRKVFEEFAAEEIEHKAKLELEVMKTGKVLTATKNPEYEDEADKNVSGTQLDMDYKDMLIMGMQKEEASFRLYVDLAARVTNEDSKETLLALAQEEVKHKLRFEMEYDNLSKTS